MDSSMRSGLKRKSTVTRSTRTICPNEIRTENRRKKYEKFRRSSRYRNRVKELLVGKVCVICTSSEGLTIHHTSEDDYRDEETYFRTLDKGVPMCARRCHREWHKGKTKICPVCGKVLIAPEYDCCWNCIPDDVKEANEVKKIRRKKKQKAFRRMQYLNAKEWRKQHGKVSQPEPAGNDSKGIGTTKNRVV